MPKEVIKYGDLNCVVRYPNDFVSGKRYPTILFLHGAGSRGTDIHVLEGNPYFSLTETHKEFPFVTVAPQCYENSWFDLMPSLKKLLKSIVDSDYADQTRVYVMGASMGGYATWQLAMSMPDAIAAIVPICGGGMYWNAARLAGVPVWAFHGEQDRTVYAEESIKMVSAVNQCGGCAKLTVYPDCQHDSWSNTYRDPAVFAWLLSNTNRAPATMPDPYCGSKKFG